MLFCPQLPLTLLLLPIAADEDDGYLVTYLMEEGSGSSSLAVFDAKTMDSKRLATIDIPHRVPAGFHGLHLKEAELRSQA